MQQNVVIYVEDNYHSRRIVNKVLCRAGFSFLEAENGLEGYEMIKTHQPDLILLDISLPEMDGIQLVGILKADETLKEIPAIALTASAMSGDRERFLRAGCDDYLSKPVKASELLEMVFSYLGHPQCL
jgi:CheY-like chemotaxis protein